jgi:hypothetical protein
MSSYILTRLEAKYIWNTMDLMAKVELINITSLKQTWSSDGFSQDVNSSHSWNQIGYKNQSAVIKTLSIFDKMPLEKYSDILEYSRLIKGLKYNRRQTRIYENEIKNIIPKVRGYI